MRTIGNNIPFTGAEYNPEDNTAEYFVDGFAIATYDFDGGEWEDFEGMDDDEWEIVCGEMHKARDRYNENVKYSA